MLISIFTCSKHYIPDQPEVSTKSCKQVGEIQHRQGKCGEVDGFSQRSTLPIIATGASQQSLKKNTQQIKGTNHATQTRRKII